MTCTLLFRFRITFLSRMQIPKFFYKVKLEVLPVVLMKHRYQNFVKFPMKFDDEYHSFLIFFPIFVFFPYNFFFMKQTYSRFSYGETRGSNGCFNQNLSQNFFEIPYEILWREIAIFDFFL